MVTAKLAPLSVTMLRVLPETDWIVPSWLVADAGAAGTCAKTHPGAKLSNAHETAISKAIRAANKQVLLVMCVLKFKAK
jgi:hypothetical protein